MRKMAKDVNRYFTKEGTHKHMKRHSTSLAVREIQIKTTMSYHDIPIPINDKIKISNYKKCW